MVVEVLTLAAALIVQSSGVVRPDLRVYRRRVVDAQLDQAIRLAAGHTELDSSQTTALYELLQNVRERAARTTTTQGFVSEATPLDPKVSIMVCDAAQVSDGKLNILGGGWTVARVPMPQSALAIQLQVPWDQANEPVPWTLTLYDADGRPVDMAGTGPLEMGGVVEFGRPAGLPVGMPLDMPVALTVPPMFLPPFGRFVWRMTLRAETRDEWSASFATVPSL